MTTFTAGFRGVLVLTIGVAGIAFAGEPTKPDVAGDPPQELLEGLGFSIAPQEGGKGRTSLFGIVAEGYKFVYAFDRSGSMGGSGRSSLKAVKAELIKSLKNLDSVHQFQIIFYNQRPAVFHPTGTPGRLSFATKRNKERVRRFIDSISAEGGTAHVEALRMAIRLQPDVIFFLTDADEPKLTPDELSKIRRTAAGVIINTIEFGPGPQPQLKPAEESFLAQLARQNGGRYVYVDISKYGTDNPTPKTEP